MGKFKVISFRYGEKITDEFDTILEAEAYFELLRNSDECFVDEIQDEQGNVLKDNKENVVGHPNYKLR